MSGTPPLEQLSTFIREQEWGWNTPSLLPLPPSTPSEVQSFLKTPLRSIDLASSDAFLSNSPAFIKTRRIGIRSERIQESLFRAHPDTRDLRSGIVIPGLTEIDLLHSIHSLPKTVLHWELAVKFYLELDQEQGFGLNRWIGPSLQDTLGIKCRTIAHKQLRALDSEAIRTSIGINEEARILPLPLMRGILFKRWTPSAPQVPVADEKEVSENILSSNGARGYWVRRSDLDAFFAQTHSSDRILLFHAREDWIRRHSIEGEARELKPRPDIQSWIDQARKYPASDARGAFEPQQGEILFRSENTRPLRFFCVPDEWETLAKTALQTLGKTP